MQEVFLFDETVDINLTQTYHLSIQLDSKHFTYTLLDSVRNRLIGIKNVDFGDVLPVNRMISKIKHALYFPV